jgi:hypothetical protein
MSSAFDTIDHETVLFHRLHTRFGLTDTVFSWLKSYLTDRPQRVFLKNTFSQSRSLASGVPQGSVLGTILFSLYLAPLEDVIKAHNLNVMFYADDSQLYVFLDQKQQQLGVEAIHLCTTDIMLWTKLNMLKYNSKKN